MANWSNPTVLSIYTAVLDDLKARDVDAITLAEAPTNLPTGSIKLNRTIKRLEEWSGAAWVVQVLDITGGGTGANTASGARTALGLGTMATQNSNAVSISGGSASGLSSLGVSGNATITGLIITGSAPTTLTNTAGQILETAIADGTLYTRNAGNETITGAWTFNTAPTLSGLNITGILEANISDGTILARVAANETISGSWVFSGTPSVSNTIPQIRWHQTDAAVDEKYWLWLAEGTVFNLTAYNDAVTGGNTPLQFTRSGTVVTNATLAATAITLTGNVTGSGTLATTGANILVGGSGIGSASRFHYNGTDTYFDTTPALGNTFWRTLNGSATLLSLSASGLNVSGTLGVTGVTTLGTVHPTRINIGGDTNLALFSPSTNILNVGDTVSTANAAGITLNRNNGGAGLVSISANTASYNFSLYGITSQTTGRSIGTNSVPFLDIYLVNSPIVTSDIRHKRNHGQIENALDMVRRTDTFVASWINGPDHLRFPSLSAQNVKEVWDDNLGTEIVKVDKFDSHAMYYERMIPGMMAALKELDGQVQRLRTAH